MSVSSPRTLVDILTGRVLSVLRRQTGSIDESTDAVSASSTRQSIENSEHYILDVVFTEDASRIRAGSAPEVAAAFRRLSLNILQQDTSLKESIRGKRLCAGWDEAVLDGIYQAFQAA